MKKKRKSGSGTVRERKDGRWEGRIVIGYDERGLPKTKNVLAKTKTECLEKLEALKETIGATEITRCTPEMPFGEWIDFWYQNYCMEHHGHNHHQWHDDQCGTTGSFYHLER